MKYISLIFNTLLICSNVFAQTADEQTAEELYAKKDYQGAAAIYEELLQQGVSADLYYNYASALYKADETGKALLYYEKALILNPLDKDTKANIEFINTQITDKIDTPQRFFLVDWLSALGKLLTTNQWAYLSIALFALFLTCLMLFFFSRYYSVRKITFFTAIFTLILSVCSVFYAFSQKRYFDNNPYAIVLSSSVSVKSSPAQSGKELFVIHEGTKVEVISDLKEWHEIRLPDGKVGWVENSSIEKI